MEIKDNSISTSKYKIIEVSLASSNPRVRLERVIGNEPVPIGTNVLKIYSQMVQSKKVRISIGYNERSVIFVKPMNMDSFILSRGWSLGIGFWSNDLRLSSSDSDNGLTLEQYYINKVYDYGQVVKELGAKKIPKTVSVTPNSPVLNNSNFKVVQINKHVTENANTNELKSKSSQSRSLKAEIKQIEAALDLKNKELIATRFLTDASRKQFENEIERLVKLKETKTNQLTSINSEMLNLTTSVSNVEDMKFRIRGFWEIPPSVLSRGSRPQEVIQFIVEWRYLSIDGKETPVEIIAINGRKVSNNIQELILLENTVEIAYFRDNQLRSLILHKTENRYFSQYKVATLHPITDEMKDNFISWANL